MRFQPDRYNCQVLHKSESVSGKYIIFLGQHFDGKATCFDLGVFNKWTGATTRVHFHDNKPAAMIEFEQFRDRMRTPSHTEEEERDKMYIIDPTTGKPTRAN